MPHDLVSSLSSFESSSAAVLCVRDAAESCRIADADEVLHAAQRLLAARVVGSDVMSSFAGGSEGLFARPAGYALA